MNRQTKTLVQAAGLLLAILPASVAFAQGPGGPMDGPRPPRPPMAGGPPATAANIPLRVLDRELKLTAEQDNTISTIQRDLESERRELAPNGPPPMRLQGPDELGPRDAGPDQQEPGSPFGAPDPRVREKIQRLDRDASEKIDAVLSDSQKAEITALLKNMNALRAAGIPPQLYFRLDLSSAQRDQIDRAVAVQQAAIKEAVSKVQASGDYDEIDEALGDAHRVTHEAVMQILTPSQRQIVLRSQPMRRGFNGPQAFGRPGGPGGPGGLQGFGGPGRPGDPQSFGGPGGPGGPQGFGGPGGPGPGGRQDMGGPGAGAPPPDAGIGAAGD